MILTATASVLSGLKSAPGAFASSQGYVISDTSAPTIFSSKVSTDVVSALEGVPEMTGISPEVFAFSSFRGMSFVVRGVDLDRLNSTGPAFLAFDVVQGESTVHANSALVGHRLLARLGVDLPCRIPLVGSYSSKLEFANIVGSYSTNSPLDDEMLVSLDVARFLSGMGKDKVSIIRVATSDPKWLAGVLSPENARFTLFDLRAEKAYVALGEHQSISVGVRNWGGKAGQTTVSLSEGADTLFMATVHLNRSSSTTLSWMFVSDHLGERSIKVSVGGDFPVSLYANFTVVEPYLRVSSPSKVLLGEEFSVAVSKFSGEPAEGAVVSFGSQVATADIDGVAILTASDTGAWTVRASMTGFSEAMATVLVQDPSAFPAEFLPAVIDFNVLPETIKESEVAKGVLTVTNGGSVGGLFRVQVLVDSSIYSTLDVPLAGMASETVRIDLSGLSTGTHTIQAGSFSRALVVEPWIVRNPDLVQLVLRYGGSITLSSSASIPVYQAAKISEGNVSVALFALGAISALLAALAIASVYSREVHESRRTLGVMKTIGASARDIRWLVLPRALETGLAGAVVGVALGIIVAEGISRSGVFMLFGHSLNIELDSQLLVMVLLAAVTVSISTALWCAIDASLQSAISSIRGLHESEVENGSPPSITDD